MTFRLRLLLLLILVAPTALWSQIIDPAQWQAKLTDGTIVLSVELDKGWHIYGMNLPEDGPVSTSFIFDDMNGATLAGEAYSEGDEIEVDDLNFGMRLRWFSDRATFSQPIEISNKERYAINGAIRYMLCNDQTCLAPTTYTFSFKKQGDTNNGTIHHDATTTSNDAPPTHLEENALWSPVIEELKALGDEASNIANHSSLPWLFLMGFIGGLVALLTPCVWPMIPMTLSFFLKRQGRKTEGKSRTNARSEIALYAISIIVIYVAMGILISLIFGASALNDLATSAFFNLIFFALLVLFAISFFGYFNIMLPASWSNHLDRVSDSTSGVVSIFFMAFTLVLVSFSCTGPIIGTLLVEASTQGTLLAPTIGMAGFAVGLALPFTLFALFPIALSQMPKSGAWLNSVKVTLGFLELAFALKFLSVADLTYGWGILPRDLFVILWVTIFVCLSLYLLGVIRFTHDERLKRIGWVRGSLSAASFLFALYMIPGIIGAQLTPLSAFAPPMNTQIIRIIEQQELETFNDYDQGMAFAQKNKQRILVNFSGYGCVNCRKMEASVWSDPAVQRLMREQFTIITLYVDDKSALPTEERITENGKTTKLKTIGDKWSYLQRSKFGANAQPYYVILDDEGRPTTSAYYYNDDPTPFIQWLNSGL